MQGLGERLRQRARELGLTDSEVARRLGLSQARYANYVNDKREPDFRTFLNICRILSTSPNRLLGFHETDRPTGLSDCAPPLFPSADRPTSADETAILRDRIRAAAEAMAAPALRTAAAVMDALVGLGSTEEKG
jgi:transcriptional regulator with XRE-family HTH domain